MLFQRFLPGVLALFASLVAVNGRLDAADLYARALDLLELEETLQARDNGPDIDDSDALLMLEAEDLEYKLQSSRRSQMGRRVSPVLDGEVSNLPCRLYSSLNKGSQRLFQRRDVCLQTVCLQPGIDGGCSGLGCGLCQANWMCGVWQGRRGSTSSEGSSSSGSSSSSSRSKSRSRGRS